jgi:beta-glucanase (GH16 family)
MKGQKVSKQQVSIIIVLLYALAPVISWAQTPILQDNFEGNGGITSWYGDDCGINTSFNNPYPTGINPSTKVLRYADIGGQYANVGFNAGFSFNLATSSVFSLKLYVPSSGITGNQNNQISLKLQNASLPQPWVTQCEIIKPVLLDQWQTISFDFATDNFINLDPNSSHPLSRWDFSRVLLQLNGENNTSHVVAYIDDFAYDGAISPSNQLVWNDEFNVNGAVNSLNWFHQTQLPNGVSWYNNELQHYTNNIANAYCGNGLLNIVAKKQVFTSQGQTKQYTSARLNSKFAFQYGRVEVRAKLPTGAGTWPAVWMLGKNIIEPGGYWTATHGTASWPACGEIDIMEHWGSNQNVISSAVHHPINGNLSVGEYTSNAQYDPNVSTEFHTYAVEWNDQSIIFSVDSINHLSYNPPVKNQYTWPFDAEQYILLNVAIEPTVAPNFVQSSMEIDYVRVYQTSMTSTANAINTPKVKLFPNPVTDQLSITGIQSVTATAEIYSLLGQKIYTCSLTGQGTMLDLTSLDNGVYLLVLITETGRETYKIMKAK